MSDTEIKSSCAACKGREWSEKNPDRLLSRLWRWHTTWCPGWKAYQRELEERERSQRTA
jgi:hypothetical protein